MRHTMVIALVASALLAPGAVAAPEALSNRARLRSEVVLAPPHEPGARFVIERSLTDYRMCTVNLCRRMGAGSNAAFAQLPQMLELPNDATWRYVTQDADGTFHCTWDLKVESTPRIETPPDRFARDP